MRSVLSRGKLLLPCLSIRGARKTFLYATVLQVSCEFLKYACVVRFGVLLCGVFSLGVCGSGEFAGVLHVSEVSLNSLEVLADFCYFILCACEVLI